MYDAGNRSHARLSISIDQYTTLDYLFQADADMRLDLDAADEIDQEGE